MKWIRKHRPSPATAIALAALVVALGGVAFAAIPDPDGTIHACYQRNTGSLRVVESQSDCRSSENAITWNQRGPQGLPGPGGDVQVIDRVTLANGESRELFAEGPITLAASCQLGVTESSGFTDDDAKILVSTTQEHSAFKASFSGAPGGGEFGPSSEEFRRVVVQARGTTSSPPSRRYTKDDFIISAPDGTYVSGAMYAGANALGEVGKCVFGGHFIVGG
jgi:hypothetical protein